jgi:hypothetical protein
LPTVQFYRSDPDLWRDLGVPTNILATRLRELEAAGALSRLPLRNNTRRVLNLGGDDLDTATPMDSILFTIMAALAQMEHEIKRERLRIPSSNEEKLARTLAAGLAGSLIVRSEALFAWSKVVSPRRRLPGISVCPERRSTGGHERLPTSRATFSAAKRPPFTANSHMQAPNFLSLSRKRGESILHETCRWQGYVSAFSQG